MWSPWLSNNLVLTATFLFPLAEYFSQIEPWISSHLSLAANFTSSLWWPLNAGLTVLHFQNINLKHQGFLKTLFQTIQYYLKYFHQKLTWLILLLKLASSLPVTLARWFTNSLHVSVFPAPLSPLITQHWEVLSFTIALYASSAIPNTWGGKAERSSDWWYSVDT